jgi:hypothetical protein
MKARPMSSPMRKALRRPAQRRVHQRSVGEGREEETMEGKVRRGKGREGKGKTHRRAPRYRTTENEREVSEEGRAGKQGEEHTKTPHLYLVAISAPIKPQTLSSAASSSVFSCIEWGGEGETVHSEESDEHCQENAGEGETGKEEQHEEHERDGESPVDVLHIKTLSSVPENGTDGGKDERERSRWRE